MVSLMCNLILKRMLLVSHLSFLTLQPHGLQQTRLTCLSLSPGDSEFCSKFMSTESVIPSNHLISYIKKDTNSTCTDGGGPRGSYLTGGRHSRFALLTTSLRSSKTEVPSDKIKAAREWTVRYREMEGSWI